MAWHCIIQYSIIISNSFLIAPSREPWELVCSDVSSYTVSLRWYRFTPDLTGSLLTGYFISYKAVHFPDPTVYNVTLESFKYNYIVEGLKGYTNYSFEMYVFNPWGKSNSSTVECRTEEGSKEYSCENSIYLRLRLSIVARFLLIIEPSVHYITVARGSEFISSFAYIYRHLVVHEQLRQRRHVLKK